MTRYEPAGPSPTATGCQPGTEALRRAIGRVWGPSVSLTGPYGCFNRRKIEGSGAWSLHAEGRALDAGVAPSSHAEGWLLACDLTAEHVRLGVQRVMWDGHIWTIEEAGQWRQLRPQTDQHLTHIHLEQRWDHALKPASVESTYAAVLAACRAQRAARHV